MRWQSVVVAPLVLCGLLLSSCALFYRRIPPVEFSLDGDNKDVELSVLNMSRGSYEERGDGVIVADIPSGGSDISFMVRSGTQTSHFMARMMGWSSIKGSMSEVNSTYGFGGGMWLAARSSSNYGHYKISGVAASPESFVVGRYMHDNGVDWPLINRVTPQTIVPLGPRSPGVFVKGRGGASVFAQIGTTITNMDLCAPIGSTAILEQGGVSKEFVVGTSLIVKLVMQPGRANIRWFPAGSEDCYVEIMIDEILDLGRIGGYRGRMTLSSMLDR